MLNFHNVWFVFGAADLELPVFAALWWNMGQSSVSCVLVGSSEAPMGSVAVDKVMLKKAEARIRIVKVRQPIVFLFISFYPLPFLSAEAASGGDKASSEAATRPSLSGTL